MRKDQLVSALIKVSKSRGRSSKRPTKVTAPSSRSRATAVSSKPKSVVSRQVTSKTVASRTRAAVVKPKSPAVARRLKQAKAKSERLKNLSLSNGAKDRNGAARDRLVVMVRDAYWLHVYWELTRMGVQRAAAAMGQDWHTARPVLRLLDVSSNGTTSNTESLIRYLDIHGGVNNWYVEVSEPPRSYRVEIGYLSTGGRFHVLARSNVVSTPRAASSDALDENWAAVAEDFEKIYAMSGGYSANGSSGELQELFEERLRRPMGTPLVTRFGAGAAKVLNPSQRKFKFEVDAELIVYGSTTPDAHVTLQGDPVELRPDGTFTVRFSLPNCRQVIPAVAASSDGVEQRTVVLAVERNTKTMEPVIRDANG